MFDYMNVELVGFTSLAIPALLITIGVFTTQQIAYKREGKAVLGVLRAVFVKPFTAIGAYFRAVAGIFRGGERSSTRHGWIGLAVGLPLMAVVLALLAGADEGGEAARRRLNHRTLAMGVARRRLFVSSMLFDRCFSTSPGKADEDLSPSGKLEDAGPGVVIGLLLAAYALFTFVQFTYSSAGAAGDLTYSEYAREGSGSFWP
jgi:hypothetical protein